MELLLLVCALFGSAYAAFLNTESFQSIAEEVNRLQTTWKAENNLPPHVTVSSFKKLLGVKHTGEKLPAKPRSLSNILIPEEFDSRKQWPHCPSIRHISDQGVCGSCWAMAAAGALSDRVCIASNGTLTAQLSQQELLSCCGDACGSGCNGGDPFQAWIFFYRHGLVTGGDYASRQGCQPYTIQPCEHHVEGSLPQCSTLPAVDTPRCEKRCTNPTYKGTFEKDHIRVKQPYSLSISENSIEEIQEEIMKHGPVEVDFTVYADFPTYKSGVYSYVTGKVLGGHAVRLIGWGSENGVPYWLAANSWRTEWGDNGLFKIRRGVNECGIEQDIVAAIPDL